MIRVALIDGSREVDNYKSCLSRLTTLSITAVVDADKSCAGRAGDELGAEFTVDTLDQLLTQRGQIIDAVLIHSPVYRRCELVRRAAQAGKHILVASPMARTTEEADTMVESCKSAGVTLMVSQPMRFALSLQVIKSRLADGKLGTPGLLRIHRWNADFEGSMSESRESDEVILSSQLTAEVDSACWLFGDSPTSVFAVSPFLPGIGFSHDIQIHLGFRSGGMALIDCCVSNESTRGPYYLLTLVGSKGAAYVDDHHNTNLLLHKSGTTALKVGCGLGHVRLLLEAFTHALRTRREPMSNGKDGRMAIAIVQAAFESRAARRAVNLSERAR